MQHRLRHLGLTVSVAAIGLILLHFLLPYLGPFVLSALLAAIIDKPVDALQRWGLPRGVAVLCVLGAAVACIALVLAAMIVNVGAELDSLYQMLPYTVADWETGIDQMTERWDALLGRLPIAIGDVTTAAMESLLALVKAASGALLKQLHKVPQFFASFLVAAIGTFFLSRDKRVLAKTYFQIMPHHWHGRLLQLKHYITSDSLNLVKIWCILFATTLLIATAGFAVFRVRYAWLLGFLAAVLDILPIVGPSGVFVPVIVYLLVLNQAGRAIGLAAIWLGLLVLRQMLEPRIMGAQLGLHPLTVIVCVYVGVKLFGVTGLWLAPFFAIMVKALHLTISPPTQQP